MNIITKIPDEWTGSATINYKLPSDSNAGDTIQTSATVRRLLFGKFGYAHYREPTQRDADTGLSGYDFADSTTGIKNQNIDGKLGLGSGGWPCARTVWYVWQANFNTNPSFKQGETGSEFCWAVMAKQTPQSPSAMAWLGMVNMTGAAVNSVFTAMSLKRKTP